MANVIFVCVNSKFIPTALRRLFDDELKKKESISFALAKFLMHFMLYISVLCPFNGFFAIFIFCNFSDAEFAFEIYDADGSKKVDAYDLGDILRALNCNPTLALIEKMGATKKRGEKLLSLEEFLPIYGQVKKEKDQGCYEDFLECLKLYDKNENGFMLLAELNHALLALGK